MVIPVTRIAGFIVFMGLPQVLGFSSAYHTRKFAPKYYPTLKKPGWAPSPSLLKPLWVLSYGLMGFASYLVWRQKIINNVGVKYPLALYCIQLFFNVFWSPLFFRFQSRILGLWCLLLNLVFAVLTALAFSPVSPTAFRLMIPYILIIVICGYLNKSVWRLNQKKAKKGKKSKKARSDSDSDSD